MLIVITVAKSASVATVAENSASSGFKFKSPSASTPSSSFLLSNKKATPSTTSVNQPGTSSDLLNEESVEGLNECNSSTFYAPELVFLVVDEVLLL